MAPDPQPRLIGSRLPAGTWSSGAIAGQEFGQAVAALCHEAGASSVQIVDMSAGFPDKWDLADPMPDDWTKERLLMLVAESKPWKAAQETPLDIEVQGDFRLVRHSTSGFRTGVYRSVDHNDSGQSWIWFCSLLEILADTRDAGNEDWGRLIRVTDRDGVAHDWSMPMAMLAGDGADYRRHLLSLGLELAPGRTNRDALQTYVMIWRPSNKARRVDKIGWNGRAFVLPDTAIGDTAGEHVLLQTTKAASTFVRPARSTIGRRM